MNGDLISPGAYVVSQGYPGACAFSGVVAEGLYQPCKLSFSSVPAAGMTITVDMSWYFWARFNDDYADFEKFADRYWLLRKITLDSLRIPPS